MTNGLRNCKIRINDFTANVEAQSIDEMFPAYSKNVNTVIIYKLTGDLEGMGEGEVTKEIEEGKPQKRIPIYYDIIKVAHHGSKYSSGCEFLHAAAPAYSIISCGADNSYGHPHKETLKRLMDSGCRIFQTPESGAVTVITDGKNMRINEWSKGG